MCSWHVWSTRRHYRGEFLPSALSIHKTRFVNRITRVPFVFLFVRRQIALVQVVRYFGFAQQIGVELGVLLPEELRHSIAFFSVLVSMTVDTDQVCAHTAYTRHFSSLSTFEVPACDDITLFFMPSCVVRMYASRATQGGKDLWFATVEEGCWISTGKIRWSLRRLAAQKHWFGQINFKRRFVLYAGDLQTRGCAWFVIVFSCTS